MLAGYPFLMLLAGCPEPPSEDCLLTSTVEGYEPACDAALVFWDEETRLRIDGRVEALLPADPEQDTTFGGTTGNPMTVFLDEELGEARESTLTLGPGLTSARLDLEFPSGRVEGIVQLEQLQGE
jgi:hypothetical protein